jgi:hypothetical protein
VDRVRRVVGARHTHRGNNNNDNNNNGIGRVRSVETSNKDLTW